LPAWAHVSSVYHCVPAGFFVPIKLFIHSSIQSDVLYCLQFVILQFACILRANGWSNWEAYLAPAESLW